MKLKDIKIICETCGKEFYISKTYLKHRNRRFCSAECRNNYFASFKKKIICIECRKEFYDKSGGNRKYCSHNCYSKSLIGLYIKEKNPNYKEMIKKICPICKKEFEVLPSRSKRIFCSHSCSLKYSHINGLIKPVKQLRGDKSRLWKGGITPLRAKIVNCSKYKKWRKSIFDRDNYTCRVCGQRGGKLEAHHLKRFSLFLSEYNIRSLDNALNCKELWDINNGETLCKFCHKTYTDFGNQW
jgi:endogenous inhibitor of DNA gyrase (YacG/DUF329 family)